MKIETTTNRETIEKMAEDLFHTKYPECIVPVDYNELRTIRKSGTFYVAISYKGDTNQISECVEQITKAISEEQRKNSVYQLFQIVIHPEYAISFEDVTPILEISRLFSNGCMIWSLSNSKELANNELVIHLMMARAKQETDKSEDEKMGMIINKYIDEKYPQEPWPEVIECEDGKLVLEVTDMPDGSQLLCYTKIVD